MSVDEKTKEIRRQKYLKAIQDYEELTKNLPKNFEVSLSIRKLCKKSKFYYENNNLLTAICLINAAIGTLKRKLNEYRYYYAV